jgi:hypothetical protein
MQKLKDFYERILNAKEDEKNKKIDELLKRIKEIEERGASLEDLQKEIDLLK